MKNKHTSPRKTSDFGQGEEAHTLVLKKKTWKFEVSQSSIGRFFGRHKKATIAVLAIVIAGIATRYALVGFASTADFYPSSCLGNWENVQNALGKPDLSPGAAASDFTTFNSAALGTSTAQMFCGNFSGDTDIAALTGKTFQEADLVLSWSFVFPEESSTAIGSDGGSGGSTTDDATSSTTVSTSTTNTSGTDVSSSTGAPVITIPTSTDSSASGTPDMTSSTPSSTPTDTDASSTTSITTNTTTTTTTDTTNTQSSTPPALPAPTSTPTPAPTPAPVPTSTPDSNPPPAPATTSSDPGPTSWLRNLVGVAYADETSSVAVAASTTGISYVQTGTSTVPTGTPINVNTAAFQNIAIPSSTGDAVLSIVYSTDGVTWQPIANIDSANWQQGRYQIPIHSWTELQNLQVAFIGLGASGTPQIFLDSVGVEVSYADAPEPDPDTVASDTTPSDPAPAPAVAPPAPAELPPVQAFKQVFDPFAGQQCSVAPFSESLAAGGGGSFLLTMTPPAASSSSASTTRAHAPKIPFLYDASVGALPDGISATIVPEGPGVDAIGITTLPSVAAGSYNAVVVYKERQNDGSVAPNFCQFNLVVTPASS